MKPNTNNLEVGLSEYAKWVSFSSVVTFVAAYPSRPIDHGEV